MTLQFVFALGKATRSTDRPCTHARHRMYRHIHGQPRFVVGRRRRAVRLSSKKSFNLGLQESKRMSSFFHRILRTSVSCCKGRRKYTSSLEKTTKTAHFKMAMASVVDMLTNAGRIMRWKSSCVMVRAASVISSTGSNSGL